MSHPLVFTKLGLLAKLGGQDNVLQREVGVYSIPLQRKDLFTVHKCEQCNVKMQTVKVSKRTQ